MRKRAHIMVAWRSSIFKKGTDKDESAVQRLYKHYEKIMEVETIEYVEIQQSRRFSEIGLQIL